MRDWQGGGESFGAETIINILFFLSLRRDWHKICSFITIAKILVLVVKRLDVCSQSWFHNWDFLLKYAAFYTHRQLGHRGVERLAQLMKGAWHLSISFTQCTTPPPPVSVYLPTWLIYSLLTHGNCSHNNPTIAINLKPFYLLTKCKQM